VAQASSDQAAGAASSEAAAGAASSERAAGAPASEVTAGAQSSEWAAGAASTTVTLPGGVDLHARPAADFVRAAMGFSASIWVAANGREADAKSLLTVLALGAKGGTELRLTAEGDDAGAALAAVRDRVATLS
jgi:phosphotransferase system HPr (HPr) family protein